MRIVVGIIAFVIGLFIPLMIAGAIGLVAGLMVDYQIPVRPRAAAELSAAVLALCWFTAYYTARDFPGAKIAFSAAYLVASIAAVCVLAHWSFPAVIAAGSPVDQ